MPGSLPNPSWRPVYSAQKAQKSWKRPTSTLNSAKIWPPAPPPQPIHIRKTLFFEISKRHNIAPIRNNIFPKMSQHRKTPNNLSNIPPNLSNPHIHTHTHTRIYILIYTPLPNSRWLHHTALRYVRRVKLGAYTWRNGLNPFKTGSKWAQNSCFCTPNGPGSLLEKRIFDPFLTH